VGARLKEAAQRRCVGTAGQGLVHGAHQARL
jgi:hypothetical protein